MWANTSLEATAYAASMSPAPGSSIVLTLFRGSVSRLCLSFIR